MVTLVGSPPNEEMYLFTQRRAARSTRFILSAFDLSITQNIGDVRTIVKTQVPNARPLHFLASQEPEDIETTIMSVEGLRRWTMIQWTRTDSSLLPK